MAQSIDKVSILICDENGDAVKEYHSVNNLPLPIPSIWDYIVYDGKSYLVKSREFLFTDSEELLEVSITLEGLSS